MLCCAQSVAGRDWKDGVMTLRPLLSSTRPGRSWARNNWRRRGEERGEICLNISRNGFQTETLEGITEALENYWEDFLTVKLLADTGLSLAKYLQIETI